MKLPAEFGRFVLIRKLGGGAAGSVYLAHTDRPDSNLPARFVVKILHAELARDASFVRRFRHEAEMSMRLRSRNVVRAYEFGTESSQLYIAMDYVEGWPMSLVLQDHAEAKARISLGSAADAMEGLLRGLGDIHALRDPDGELGLVHRDVSPRNLLLTTDGEAVLIDLGLGRSRRQDWKTATGAILGSPGYMSPEQVLGRPVDERADLYSAALVFFEMIAGVPYIQQKTVQALLAASVSPPKRRLHDYRPDVPSDVESLLDRALQLDPNERFQSASVFVNALRQAIPASGSEDRHLARSMVGQMRWKDLDTWRIESEGPSEKTELLSGGDSATRITAPVSPPQADSPGRTRSARVLAPVAIGAGVVLFAAGWWMGRQSSTPLQTIPVPRSEPPTDPPVEAKPLTGPGDPVLTETRTDGDPNSERDSEPGAGPKWQRSRPNTAPEVSTETPKAPPSPKRTPSSPSRAARPRPNPNTEASAPEPEAQVTVDQVRAALRRLEGREPERAEKLLVSLLEAQALGRADPAFLRDLLRRARQ